MWNLTTEHQRCLEDIAWIGKTLDKEESFEDWLAKDLREIPTFSSINTKVMLQYFKKKILEQDSKQQHAQKFLNEADIERELLRGINKPLYEIRNPATWLYIEEANSLILNCHRRLPSLIHKDWHPVGKEVGQTLDAKIKLLALSGQIDDDFLFGSLQKKNNRMNKHSIIGTYDSGRDYRDMIFLFHPSLWDELLGHGPHYYMGYIEAIIEHAKFKNQNMMLRYNSMRLDNIINKLMGLNIVIKRKDGFVFIGKDNEPYAKEVELERKKTGDRMVLASSYHTEAKNPNAVVLLRDYHIPSGITLFKQGEIYEAPYTRVKVGFEQTSVSKIFYFLRKSTQFLRILNDYDETKKHLEEQHFMAQERRRRLVQKNEDIGMIISQINSVFVHKNNSINTTLKTSWAALEKYTSILSEREFPEKSDESYPLFEHVRAHFKENLPMKNYQVKKKRDEIYKKISRYVKESPKKVAEDIAMLELNHMHMELLYRLYEQKRAPDIGFLTAIRNYHMYSKRIEDCFSQIDRNNEEHMRLSRSLQAGITEVEAKDVDLVMQIESSFDEYRARLADIEYAIECTTEGHIKSYPPLLNEVMGILINNSADAMHESGRIYVNINDHPKEPDKVMIRFADTGESIKEEDIPKLFNNFFTLKSANSGMGMGLSLAKFMVELIGGAIEYDRQSKQGAVFNVTLPRDARRQYYQAD